MKRMKLQGWMKKVGDSKVVEKEVGLWLPGECWHLVAKVVVAYLYSQSIGLNGMAMEISKHTSYRLRFCLWYLLSGFKMDN